MSDGSFPFEHDGVHFEVQVCRLRVMTRQANDVHPELCCSQRNTFDLFIDGEEVDTGIYKEKYLKSTSCR